jgi:hypothetical protein
VITGVTRGWVTRESPAPEDVHDHLEEICDDGQMSVPGSLAEEIELARSILALK